MHQHGPRWVTVLLGELAMPVAISEHVAVVVEDDMAMRQAIERVLNARGIPVLAFDSAESAMGAGAASRAACMVVDIKLPGLSGFEFYEALGARPPVIFITADDDPVVAERARRLGAAGFFHKPFSGRSLADLVASLWGTP